MIEVFFGAGSGKTSAAVGRAIRAAGNGLPVLFVSFLKDGSSGEISVLSKTEGIRIVFCKEFFGFVIEMNDDQIKKTQEHYVQLINYVHAFCEENIINDNKLKGVIILDEILHAYKARLVEHDKVINLLNKYRDSFEFILTGSVENNTLNEMADYVTCFVNVKHPYQLGVSARRGIEY